jgi:hypothetical protein
MAFMFFIINAFGLQLFPQPACIALQDQINLLRPKSCHGLHGVSPIGLKKSVLIREIRG